MKLGLGTVQLGTNYGINNKTGKPDSEEALRILTYALSNGITVLDTAKSYGNSETLIGGLPSSAAFKVCTKLRKLDDMPEHLLRDAIKAEIDDSLRRLNTNHIHYYLLHQAADLFMFGQKIVDILHEFQKSGVLGKIGVSAYSPEDVLLGLQLNVDVVQVPFNALDTRLLSSGILEKAQKQGVEIHARSVYLQGLLCMQPQEVMSKCKEAAPYICRLHELAEQFQMSVEALCMAFVRDNPFIDIFFIGVERLEQLEANITLYHGKKLTAAQYKQIAHTFADIPETIVNPVLWRQ